MAIDNTYGNTAPYGELDYKGEEVINGLPSHYPALLDLGNYTNTFPIGNGYEQ